MVDDGWVLPDEQPGERALALEVAKRPVLAISAIDDGWVLPEEDPAPVPSMHLTAFCRCGFVSQTCASPTCPRCGSAMLLSTRTPRVANHVVRSPRRRHSHLPGIDARAPRPRPLNRVPARLRSRVTRVQPRPNLHLGIVVPIIVAVMALAGTATWLVVG